MLHRTHLIVIFITGITLMLGCSGSQTASPIMPGNDPAVTQGSSSSISNGQYLLGYYDIYFDIGTASFEIVENRTAAFTLNIVPFLNKMTIPQNGITFDSIVLHQDDPAFLGVDVEFTIYHPFPGYDQYDAYDLRGVIISDGADMLAYENLYTAQHGTDLWMKNPDGYTRWFNPTEFTSETIFGYYPGGWQNLEGNALLNPYKYYSKHLQKDDNLWSYLTGNNNWDGIFEGGAGRTMELEFPFPPDGLGIMFGYAVVVCWEDQGSEPPYYPVHVPEALAASVTVTPDIWYNEIDGSGGDLILDIDLFAWEHQPELIKIESSVLDSIAEFDFETYAGVGGEHFSTWHVEGTAKSLNTADDHYFWVIAEYENFDYSNGVTGIPFPSDPLAAFYRYDLEIGTGPDNVPPVCDVQVVGGNPVQTWEFPVEVTFDASGSYDPDPGDSIASYEWDFDGDDLYGESPDDDFLGGDEIFPVRSYDAPYTGIINLKITDTHGADTICSIDPFIVEDASCDFSVMPEECTYTTGDLRNRMQVGAEPTRADPISRLLAMRREDTPPYHYDWTCYNVDDGGMTRVGDTPNSSNSSWQPLSFVVDSYDRVYYYDYGDAPGYNQLYYCEWDSTNLTFIKMRTPFGPALPETRSIHRVTVDVDDNPVIITRRVSGSTSYYDFYIQHWNGTGWDPEKQIASTIIEECREAFIRIEDFDCNPVTGDYILIEDDGFTGIFALDQDTLEINFREDNIFGLSSQTDYRSGIFIDKGSPECRMFIISGTWIADCDSYCARYTQIYGEKATSVLTCSETPYTTPLYGTGCVVANNEDPPTYYYMGEGWSDNYNYRPISKVEIPAW